MRIGGWMFGEIRQNLRDARLAFAAEGPADLELLDAP